jgi:hypothetical protein
MTPATYSAREQLRDGRPIEMRALRPTDEAGMLDAINHTNAESLRRRFFVTKRGFSEKEKSFFMNDRLVIANQITQACGWKQAPRYLIRDRDGAYGEVYSKSSIHGHS